MFIVTGGAGFIGSAVVWQLNRQGIDDILVVDRLGETEKWRNLVPLRYRDYLRKDRFLAQIVEDRVPFAVDGVIHMGACSATTERDGTTSWRTISITAAGWPSGPWPRGSP